jgi:CRISPR-associated protein Cas1
MAVVYITDQGASISKSGDRIYVKKGNQVVRWILAKDIDQLILLGNIALSAQSVTYLLMNKIDTVFLTYYGKYKGRLIGEFGKNVFLRVDQFRFMESEKLKLELAKQFVIAKIANSLYIMRKRAQRKFDEVVSKSIMQNKAILKYSLDSIDSLAELRGYEGIAAKNYFSAFGRLIKNEDFSFTGRNRRPPKDEINALLSLGYTLLMSQFLSKTYLIGLDPYYGSLHSADYGRESLVLDIMEEFRPLIDDLILTIINRRELNKSHFQYNTRVDDEVMEENELEQRKLPVSLSSDGMKKFIYRYTKMLNSEFSYKRLNITLSLDKILLSQTRLLAAHIQNKEKYSGYRLEEEDYRA